VHHNGIIGKAGILGNGITCVFDSTVWCCDKDDIRMSGDVPWNIAEMIGMNNIGNMSG
jgi:predicted metal-binding transcription factor (methanogenesis marker protein 9)